MKEHPSSVGDLMDLVKDQRARIAELEVEVARLRAAAQEVAERAGRLCSPAGEAVTEFLVPNGKTGLGHYHDPYTQAGARSIVRRFKDDVIAMLDYMVQVSDIYKDSPSPDGAGGKAFLAQSPLRKKPWVAGAMKTLGLVTEVPSPNGACALSLTQKAIDQLAALRKY